MIEARSDGELYGDSRLAESVGVAVGSDSETIARGAVEAAKRFAAGRLQDDVAVVALQFMNNY